MPNFSNISRRILSTCHEDIQLIMNEAIKFYDFKVICGYRNRQEQNLAYEAGASQKKFPNSKHNTSPSTAIDIVPTKHLYKDKRDFYFMSGMIQMIAIQLREQGKINKILRWGGDWDSDKDFTDQTFHDLAHFELL